MAKIKSFKILKSFSNDGKKFQIVLDNGKKKLIKIFHKKKDYSKYYSEINGYKFYSKNKIFKIPKLYSYSNKKKKLVIEFIDGKKTSPFDFKKIKNKINRNKIFKINLDTYLKNLKTKYHFNIDCINFLKKIENKISKNKKILVSETHGDFSNFNCLNVNNIFYVIDFEKFSKRIVLFDNLNWYIQYIFFNIAKIYGKKIPIKLNNIFLLKISELVNLLIKAINRKQIKYLKIKKSDLNIYLLLYYFEKILILENDHKYIQNQKNKRITKNLIYILKVNINFMLNEKKF